MNCFLGQIVTQSYKLRYELTLFSSFGISFIGIVFDSETKMPSLFCQYKIIFTLNISRGTATHLK